MENLEPKLPEDYSLDEILSEDFLKDLGLDDTPPEAPVEASDPEPERAVPAEERVPRKPEKKSNWQVGLLQYLHDIVYLLAAVILVFLLLFRVVVVSGPSMQNTLQNGDYLLLISSVFYKNPQQGDIVVASKASFKDGAPIVKRVIATEGQEVYIDFREGIVYVDKVPLEETYVIGATVDDEGMKENPVTVPQGCVFVMGDNREDSTDSRSQKIGMIDKREIMGKVIFLFLPGVQSGGRDFSRIGGVA